MSLKVYDIRGATMETLASGTFAPGTYSFTVDPARLPAGVYLLGLNQGGVREGRKFVVLR